jgi:hypothetical protein
MNDWISHPAVQGGVAPFLAALAAAAVLQFARLGGLAILAGFATVAMLLNGFAFSPLTATRKMILLGLSAPVLGVLADFVLRDERWIRAGIALLCGAVVPWAFLAVLDQRSSAEGYAVGAGLFAYVAVLVALTAGLRADGVRAGAAGLALGLGSGICAILSASALYGLYGIALGAAAGGFLLVSMVRGKAIAAGWTFACPAGLVAGLIGAGSLLLAQLPWYSLPAMLLVPLAARIPAPVSPVWLRAIATSVYAFAAAAVPAGLAWYASHGGAG